MAKTVSIVNQKGGVGKTSLTFNVGAVIAGELGKRVLFVDSDGQANLTTAIGINPDDVKQGTAELLLTKDPRTKDFIIPTEIENADLVPSNQNLYGAEVDLYRLADRSFRLNDALEHIRSQYDLILIDTPPNLGALTAGALVASNGVIFVYTASEFSLEGLNQIVGSLREIQGNKRLNINGTKILGAVLNRYKIATKTVNRLLSDELARATIIPRFFSPISDSTEIEKSQFEHKPITDYNSRHKVSNEFRQFAGELIECLTT